MYHILRNSAECYPPKNLVELWTCMLFSPSIPNSILIFLNFPFPYCFHVQVSLSPLIPISSILRPWFMYPYTLFCSFLSFCIVNSSRFFIISVWYLISMFLISLLLISSCLFLIYLLYFRVSLFLFLLSFMFLYFLLCNDLHLWPITNFRCFVARGVGGGRGLVIFRNRSRDLQQLD
jgi:hypothetical protein